MSRCAQQLVWIQSWLDEVDIEYSTLGLIKGDNRGAIALTKNMKGHGKVKHIDIRHHYIWELLDEGFVTKPLLIIWQTCLLNHIEGYGNNMMILSI